MAFCLETEALASYNYLTRLVRDEPGYTFFDVYRTEPAEAAHDWPDFLDVPARSAETGVLLRHMTGQAVPTEEEFFARIYRYQEADGLFWRPETAITRHCVEGEECLVAAALVARAVADGDAEAERRLAALVAGRLAQGPLPGPFWGMGLRPYVAAHELLGVPGALELARRYRDAVVPLFRPDGSFAGHVHSHLYAAAGLCELGRIDSDQTLIDLAERVFRVIRGRSTEFGFVPELTERDDDVIGCETCCLMDFIHLGLSLARAGHRAYYDDVERAVRNHLVESRVKHGDWLAEDPGAEDDELILRRGLRAAVVGAYAGWSSPNHILAYDEHLPAAWIKEPSLAPVYLDKVRALQNCCSPSGPKALYLAWQHAARVDGETLWVNLLMDRSLPEAEVRDWPPPAGRLDVTLRAPLRIAVRRPDCADEPRWIFADQRALPVRSEGGYLISEPLPAGTACSLVWTPRPRTETVVIGNAGHQQYRYAVTWSGSTVTRLEADPGNARLGRSHLMAEPVPLYYGPDGPHPLYQARLAARPGPGTAPLHTAVGPAIW